MEKNIQAVATENAQIQNLQNQVAEMKYQLKESQKTIDIYYNIVRYGRYEVVDNEELYECMICIGVGSCMEKIKELNLFDNQKERGQEVYLTYNTKDGWYINYKNAAGIIVTMKAHQLILDSHEYNLLDAFDDLK